MSTGNSYLSNADPAAIEQLYKNYLQDPDSVDFGWRKFFEGFDFARATYGDEPATGTVPANVLKEIKVLNLIDDYRSRGHLFTHTNPVRDRRKYSPTLDLENFGLEPADLDLVFQAGTEVGLGAASLRDIVSLLQQTYCQSIGAEYKFIRNQEHVNWLRDRMEAERNTPAFTLEEKKHILSKVNQAVAFESFLGTKFVGQKRFSLEGAETLIPAMDSIIEKGTELGVAEFFIGMAHRGRLNVLANILGKTYEEIFSEFEGKPLEDESGMYTGDVKYHLGFNQEITTSKGHPAYLTLCPNPSHLESVDPVAVGQARSKMDQKYNRDPLKVAPILIHGDASIAGQGVVYEVIQMSEIEAYQTGGTMHIVVNNQVGFTTNYADARSSIYCTDVAKVTQSPVFHVNGDDVEAVVYAVKLAMEFRQKFRKDVFIDLLCYRRHGHNEADEPRFTQPTLYKLIEKHKNPREIYFEKLASQGSVEANLAKEMDRSFRKFLQERLDNVKQNPVGKQYSFFQSTWKDLRPANAEDWEKPSPETGVSEAMLRPLAEKMLSLPADLSFYDKIVKITESRREMLKPGGRLDWSMGELLAYASLLNEGHPVRFTGQDVERGTFAHRHAVLVVQDTEKEYIPLNHLSENQAKMDIYNSLLSEFAVLGFEFGYSLSAPNSLCIWEAQFGDFANGAQIIIDQYLSCSLTKWNRMSGLVMLLPHGFEGQGPEHSSARLERFLELCAGFNMQVCNITTPGNYFHLLRRQVKQPFRLPLVVMSPKNLLRLPEATSDFSELTRGRFEEVIDDASVNASKVKKVLLCSGKIYYELAARRASAGREEDVAILRLEQIAPLPLFRLRELKAKYKNAVRWAWVQEEPENMGAWPFLLRKISREFALEAVTRRESASPATGYKKVHDSEQNQLLDQAFDLQSETPKKNSVLVNK